MPQRYYRFRCVYRHHKQDSYDPFLLRRVSVRSKVLQYEPERDEQRDEHEPGSDEHRGGVEVPVEPLETRGFIRRHRLIPRALIPGALRPVDHDVISRSKELAAGTAAGTAPACRRSHPTDGRAPSVHRPRTPSSGRRTSHCPRREMAQAQGER